ncbi:MAG TPA: SDR family oxidoreductase, partial [Candidatus Cloacimonadota bacterium]|nr:SDR family oxidoreductase [Candidatus Cloacimonadota bacterium]
LRSYDALPLGDTDPQTYHHIFETNFYSAYNILRTSLPMMQKVKWGRVVLFGSDVSAKGLALGSAYAAAKAAMANLARSAAREYAASGILINTISPAPVDTDLGSDYQDHYLEFRQRYFAQYLQSSATGKLISLPELKTVVDMLINPLLESLCGEEIFLRGGII